MVPRLQAPPSRGVQTLTAVNRFERSYIVEKSSGFRLERDEASGEAPEAAVKALAEGLETGHGGANLTAVHSTGGQSSGGKFHGESWLDFNMLQSGHVPDRANYDVIAAD